MASNQQIATPPTDGQTDNISVRVIALAHATNENEDVHLVVSLDTTVLELKNRLQQSLSNNPRPETQRLIYQGRPLTNGDARLRQILRLEPNNASSPPAHVLHLVVRDDQSSDTPTAARPQSAPVQPPPTTEDGTNRNGSTLANTPLELAQQALQGHPAQGLLQNVLQQHMAIHNQHLQQQIPNGHHNPWPIPTFNLPQLPGMPAGPPQVARATPQQPSPVPSTNIATNALNTHASGPNNPPNVVQSMTMRVQEAIGPNGERIRRVVHQGPTLPVSAIPVERSASSPGTMPRPLSPNNPGRSGANQSSIPRPAAHPSHPNFPLHLPHPAFSRLPTVPNYSNPPAFMQPPRNTTVYLASSPGGPEALLFAPNHGLFSSQQTPPATTSNQPNIEPSEASNPLQQPTPTPTAPLAQQARENTRNNDQAQVAIRPQAAAQAQAQPGRREGEDLVALVLQRGWLFLRLYMFIFVLSEPATWRRYIMLTIASLVCLLPRNNPFTDLFQAARRHFDNIIGPPQPPARQGQQAQGQQTAGDQNNGNNTLNGTANTATTTNGDSMPTPEQHARRLLQQHEQRNPNMVRDIIYRIEQAVALFLASLIPGVGERHVRAREEARRIVQEENERQRRLDDERAQQTLLPDSEIKSEVVGNEQSNSGLSGIEATATATGADTAASTSAIESTANEGLRQRAVDTE